MYKKRVLYLLYRRLRAPLGISFGFVLMYAALVQNIHASIIFAALSFFAIELFGGFYNDYWDYEEDKRNSRKDKFTTEGLLSRKHMWNISFLIVISSMIFLFYTNIFVIVLGLYALFLFAAYSHPKIKLKGSVKGYTALSSMFLFLPLVLSTIAGSSNIFLLSITLFFFFQFMYILTQKDSTDTKDDKNIFLDSGWSKSSFITLSFAVLSSAMLLWISFMKPVFFIFWGINLISKILNVHMIQQKIITRWARSKLILMEFITPYMYVAGGLLA